MNVALLLSKANYSSEGVYSYNPKMVTMVTDSGSFVYGRLCKVVKFVRKRKVSWKYLRSPFYL